MSSDRREDRARAAKNVTQKLIAPHLVSGDSASPGTEIALSIDQTLTQDATGTLVMLELEALGLDVARTELSCQYVDHNLVQEDHKNADDHLFLESACERFGFWFSRPGNGVSHPVHMERFGRPGATLLGSDSHTPAAGALGMLAIGAGGSDVAMAVAGFPFHLAMPEIWGVELTNRLPDWVSAKDVVLEMLRRHGVRGGRGRIIEYYGEGLAGLSAMDRHVIANMGTELGATSSVFPADGEVERFLKEQDRPGDFRPILADEGAGYDVRDTIDLGSLEPLIAMPSSPGNVRPVREVEGEPIYQAYLGSSANPGFRDFAIAALMLDGNGKSVHDGVSFDVSPTSRQVLTRLIEAGHLSRLVSAGARLHQAGCNGCIGMGQAPASGRLSLRTVPRNFPGRSGVKDDRVCLASPETVTASALRGVITDPRTMSGSYPRVETGVAGTRPLDLIKGPSRHRDGVVHALVKGPNIVSLPELEPFPEDLKLLPVLLRVGDDLSTDEILPGGTRVLPFRSNVPEISRFCFEGVDESYPERALALDGEGDDVGRHGARTRAHAILAGHNYGQGSSREHAALAPRYLGLRVVVAKSFARIHRQNLVNFGVLPLCFVEEAVYARVEPGSHLTITGVMRQLEAGPSVVVENDGGEPFEARHELSPRELDVLRRGGLIGWARDAMTKEV